MSKPSSSLSGFSVSMSLPRRVVLSSSSSILALGDSSVTGRPKISIVNWVVTSSSSSDFIVVDSSTKSLRMRTAGTEDISPVVDSVADSSPILDLISKST